MGPRGSVTSGAGPAWTVLAVCWSLVGLAFVTWCGARAAAWATGGSVTSFSTKFFVLVLSGHGRQAWPQTPAVAAFAGMTAAALLAVGIATAGWIAIARKLGTPDDPTRSLADETAVRSLTRASVTDKATRLRATSTPKNDGEIGLALGALVQAARHKGTPVFAGWEDTLIACMAPRSGKTTALSVPFTLSAPGAVIATSNKADLWAATAALREQSGSKCWLFDPNQITRQQQGFWWNPLRGLGTVEDADRLAGHFVLTVADDKKRDLWGPAAQDLLAALLLAAAASGATMDDVARWLAEPTVPTPIELLADAGFTAMAVSLRGAQNGAPETRDGIYQTARTAARCLTDPGIMAWVTPPRRELPCFAPERFAASRGTLYLLSKSRSAAAPLIAALTDTTMRAAERRAETLGGRLDPPLVVALDEAANICRISDLPDLYSHLGSRGIVPVTILQSYEQGAGVWGEQGMAALWSAATIKLIGAGADSPRLARDLSALVGQHDVPIRSVSYSDGKVSESVSLRRQDILEPAAIRALPPGTALLLATGLKPALVRLVPWWKGPRSRDIGICRDKAELAIRDAAIRAETS
jgi:type IV secretory pathway TraG/TraD family ATPase VirD4